MPYAISGWVAASADGQTTPYITTLLHVCKLSNNCATAGWNGTPDCRRLADLCSTRDTPSPSTRPWLPTESQATPAVVPCHHSGCCLRSVQQHQSNGPTLPRTDDGRRRPPESAQRTRRPGAACITRPGLDPEEAGGRQAALPLPTAVNVVRPDDRVFELLDLVPRGLRVSDASSAAERECRVARAVLH